MTKKLIIAALTGAALCVPVPAMADEIAAWALVDDSGSVLNVVVCTAAVCGDTDSAVSKSLPTGQHYVLQAQKDDTGNVAGWFQNTTYDTPTNTFTLPGFATLVGGSKLSDVVVPEIKCLDQDYSITWTQRPGAKFDNSGSCVLASDVVKLIEPAAVTTVKATSLKKKPVKRKKAKR